MKGTLGFTFRVLRGTAVVQRLVRDEDGGAQQAELLGVRSVYHPISRNTNIYRFVRIRIIYLIHLKNKALYLLV